MDGSENSMVDIPENIIENFDIPNELNINDNNNYINLDEDNGNSFNLRVNSLNSNMKIDDYFK